MGLSAFNRARRAKTEAEQLHSMQSEPLANPEPTELPADDTPQPEDAPAAKKKGK